MKKGMSWQMIVWILASLAGLAVMLAIVLPPFLEQIEQTGGAGECQVAVLLGGIAAKAKLGTGVDIKTGCKIEQKTIELKDIKPYAQLSKKRIDKYQQSLTGLLRRDPNYCNTGMNFLKPECYFEDTFYGYDKWGLSKMVVDRMMDCYNRGWRGSLDLAAAGLPVNLMDDLEFGEVVCIVCSRLKYSDDLRARFQREPKIALRPWMEGNNIEGKNYVNFFTTNLEKSDLFTKFITGAYIDLNKKQVIVYVADKNYEELIVKFGEEAYGGVGVFDYAKLTSDLGYTRILTPGMFPELLPELRGAKETQARCKEIIGEFA